MSWVELAAALYSIEKIAGAVLGVVVVCIGLYLTIRHHGD